jgi:hypothetical protein
MKLVSSWKGQAQDLYERTCDFLRTWIVTRLQIEMEAIIQYLRFPLQYLFISVTLV